MAWSDEGNCFGISGERYITLGEEATGVGTKTLNWPADVQTVLGSGVVLYPLLEIVSVRIELAPTATGGTRRAKIQILQSDNDVLAELVSATTAAANPAVTIFEFMAGLAGAAEASGGTVTRCPMPLGFLLAPGQKLVATQDAVIDATDTAVVHVRARILADL